MHSSIPNIFGFACLHTYARTNATNLVCHRMMECSEYDYIHAMPQAFEFPHQK